MSKDLAQLSVEELIELAKQPLKEDNSKNKHLPVIKQFVIGDGIEQGEDLVPAALIYDRYQKWAKINNLEDIGNVRFFKELKIYFNKVRKSDAFYYQMSQKGFDLSPEHIELVNSKSVKRNSRGWKKRQKQKTTVQS